MTAVTVVTNKEIVGGWVIYTDYYRGRKPKNPQHTRNVLHTMQVASHLVYSLCLCTWVMVIYSYSLLKLYAMLIIYAVGVVIYQFINVIVDITISLVSVQ